MDITSFSLGILFTLVVGMLTVTIYNLFRVYNINKEMKSLYRRIEESQQQTFNEIRGVWDSIDRRDSSIDSRLDKLIHRLDRLEREHLGTSRDECKTERVKKLQKELLND